MSADLSSPLTADDVERFRGIVREMPSNPSMWHHAPLFQRVCVALEDADEVHRLRVLCDDQSNRIAVLTALTEQKSWRCFNCDAVFTDVREAAQHFVPNGPNSIVACYRRACEAQIKAIENRAVEWRAGADADLRRAAEIVRRSARRFPRSGHEISENALADRLEALGAAALPTPLPRDPHA